MAPDGFLQSGKAGAHEFLGQVAVDRIGTPRVGIEQGVRQQHGIVEQHGPPRVPVGNRVRDTGSSGISHRRQDLEGFDGFAGQIGAVERVGRGEQGATGACARIHEDQARAPGPGTPLPVVAPEGGPKAVHKPVELGRPRGQRLEPNGTCHHADPLGLVLESGHRGETVRIRRERHNAGVVEARRGIVERVNRVGGGRGPVSIAAGGRLRQGEERGAG